MIMNFRFIYLLVLLVIINTYQVYAQVWKIDDGFELEDPNIGTYSDLYDHIEILYDSTGTLTYEDIILNHLPFEKNNTKERFQKDGVYWFKTSIKGSEQVDGKYLFSNGLNMAIWPIVGFSMATWPFIDVYIQEGDSVRLLKTGFKRKPGEKEFRNGFSYFWMDLKTNDQKTI